VLLAIVVRPWALLALLAVVPAVSAARSVHGGARGRDLVPVLVRTGQVQLVYGALLAAGLAVG
jgi:1,4-dihydroxy-2-naphthoate octaprenyltransferase